MRKLGLLHEGKSMKVFSTDRPDQVVLEYKDDLSDDSGWRIGTVPGKGALDNRITNLLMRVLERNGIHTQYLEELTDRETLVRRCEMIPLELIARNVAAGRMAQRFGMEVGTALRSTVLEYTYKSDELGDPEVNSSHILAMGWADDNALKQMERCALKVNDILRRYLRTVEIELVDMKLEFGYDSEGKLTLADEISPDTCRFWDLRNHESLDRSRLEDSAVGELPSIYRRVAERLLQLDGD